MKLTFIDAGSYGTAMANHFADHTKFEAMVFSRNPNNVDEISRERTNIKYLRELPLSDFFSIDMRNMCFQLNVGRR